MRITVLTFGSRGDVQPLIALGRGLKAHGHDVRLATHELFKGFVEANGLAFAPVAGNPVELLTSPVGQAWVKAGRNPFKFLRHFVRLTRPGLPRVLGDSVAASEGSDLIIYSVLSHAGYHIAENMGIPSIAAGLQPMTPTSAFASIGSVGEIGLPGLNRLGHFVVQQALWQPFRRMVNDWREQELGLPRLPFLGPYGTDRLKDSLTVYGYSPSVLPKPDDWGPREQVTGYWFLDPPDAWSPPERLTRFLREGEPPVYLGFGSMISGAEEDETRVVLSALRRLNVRGIIQHGWGGLAEAELPPGVLAIGDVPHEWLFPQMAVVAHHGGAGTTGSGLRAGVPNVIVPHFADQFFWANRVRRLSAGPDPVPRSRLSDAALTVALDRAMRDSRLRAGAAAIGARIRQEDGVGTAVQAIEAG